MSRSSRSPHSARGARRVRRAHASSWWARARAAISDSLRDHPVFSFDKRFDAPADPAVVEASGLTEIERESLYLTQWLRIFLVRLRLAATIGLMCLATFVGFYFLVYPGISRLILGVAAMISWALLAQIGLSLRVRSLAQARWLTLAGFSLFAIGTAVAISFVTAGQNSPDLEAARAVQFVLRASFAHILVTMLLLPLRLSDTLIMSAITMSALGFGLRAAPEPMRNSSSLGAVFVVGTLALFVAMLTQFNLRLRRRAFDAAFDLALQAAELKAMSETDALTGGFNRRYGERMLNLELARAGRFSHPLSLLMFDLDNFKPVNDTLGHAAGDQVLNAIHAVAHSGLREVDTLARIGGDEFLILLPETNEPQAYRIARRLHTRVARDLTARFGSDSLLGRVTLSVGVITLEAGHRLDAETVLERVDQLLYDAKNQGKNRIVVSLVP